MTKFTLSSLFFILAACSAETSNPEISKKETSGVGVVIYTAEKVITVDDDLPEAEAVAVNMDGDIVAVGALNTLQEQLKSAVLDTRFEEKIIVPGLIDPHIHMALGAAMYSLDFIPPWDMETPNGLVKGLGDKEVLLAKIAEFEASAPDGPLILYGYHNLVQGDLTRQDLDAISTSRPIYIWHYSGHDFYLNSAAYEAANVTSETAKQVRGIGLDENGALNGRIYEDGSTVLLEAIAPLILNPKSFAEGWHGYEALFTSAGVTTVAEMAYGIFGRQFENAMINIHYTKDDPYKLYLVPEYRAFTKEFNEEASAQIIALSQESNLPAVVLPQVKLFTDAAFYSQTMKLSAPGYINGQSKGTDGLWVTEPENLADVMRPLWQAGLDIHIHSNGDAAQDSTLNAFAEMPEGNEKQRLIIEHGGLILPTQVARAAELGVGVSAASHYVYYMGQTYRDVIADKADHITPLASTIAAGIPTTVHSDAPLAPPHPLKAASVHMTRATRQGGVGNASEKLSAEQALKVITLDAAWSLGLEDQIGSIEVGKRADFTILEQNPLTTTAEDWPNIGVWGVMLNGDVRPKQK